MNELFRTGLAGDGFIPVDARAALVIVHGLGEHRGRYRAVAEHLEATGIACFTYDQRGHGQSPGARTHIGSFSDLTDDLADVVAAVRATYPTWPVFLWGHSLGSVVVLSYALKHPDFMRGGVTTGCPLAALPPLARRFSKIGAKLCAMLPAIRVRSQLDPVLLSHDENVQRAYRDDPLVTKTVTLGLVFELLEEIKRVVKEAGQIRAAWLAVHGSEDEIAPPEGSRLLIDALGSEDKRFVIIEASRHEVQNEQPAQRERFLSLLTEWISERSAVQTEDTTLPTGIRPG